MLPQVATHVFHHTTRVVAAAPLRNVLGTTTAPDRAHGHGAGAGGSKYHAGSRFYSGYQGPGRAVTQANTTTANDAPQADDEDFRVPSSSSRKIRNRSSSYSLGSGAHGRTARAQSLGVLRAVQAHYHSRQVFASIPRPLLTAAPAAVEEHEIERPVSPRLVRRNSTASTVSLSSAADEPLPPSRAASPKPPASTDPAAPQTVLPPSLEEDTEFTRLLRRANGSPSQIRAAIEHLRAPETKSVVSEWNAAIGALVSVRMWSEPLSEILQLYNDMVDRNIRPDLTTYETLLDVLLKRESTVQENIAAIQDKMLRRKVLPVQGDANEQLDFGDRQAIAALEVESNYSSAMAIFQTVNTVDGWRFNHSIYFQLLMAAAKRADIENALLIFGHMEKTKMRAQPLQYAILIRAYANVGDYDGAKVVFEEALRLQKERVFSLGKDVDDGRAHLIDLYNDMIRAHILAGEAPLAIALLENMMDTPNGVEFNVEDTPCPSAATYDSIVQAFWEAKDLDSAYSWYQQLARNGRALQQKRNWALGYAPRPSSNVFVGLMKELAVDGRVEELNQLVESFESRFFQMPHAFRFLVYAANVRDLQERVPPPAVISERLDWVFASVLDAKELVSKVALDFGMDLSPVVFVPAVELYVRAGDYARAADVALLCIDGQRNEKSLLTIRGAWGKGDRLLEALVVSHEGTPLTPAIRDLCPAFLGWRKRGLRVPQVFIEGIIRSFEYEMAQGNIGQFTQEEWGMVNTLLPYASPLTDPKSSTRIEAAMKAMKEADMPPHYTLRLVRVLSNVQGNEHTEAFLSTLGPDWEALLPRVASPTTPELTSAETQSVDSAELAERASTPATEVSSTLESGSARLDRFMSGQVMELAARKSSNEEIDEMFHLLTSQAHQGVYTYARSYALFLSLLGRRHDIPRMEAIYALGHNAVPLMQENEQRDAWRLLEDAMIIGYAHAGEAQRADVHRVRLLDEGMTPSADAYAALVQAVHATTDDTANAMAYFDEARARGVQPNLFMYNTAISKLAKARKADQALELFKELKKSHAKPSAVTYGALISACCRVGDITNAEQLFEEMVQNTHSGRLRVPPFNTMMQFFVHTKPNRGRFLQYYSRLRRAGIALTEHTYKLVLDAYGTIEPVDFAAMEATFDALCKDRNVKVHGVHWASLINAYGCVGKDLQKAIDVFESIPSHPHTQLGHGPVRAAVVYEALFNVFITHHRMDLVPAYLERMQSEGVYLTAYVLNPLIRGHALVGDIESARAIFANMVDPPSGVAAPNNHAPHDATQQAVGSQPGAPVYREPSTWEAMVRAELGQGNRNEAIALLERLRERHYPESIYNRISGIMLDDSVSPWPATMSSDHPLASSA